MDDSKFVKYGSSSGSLRSRVEGGNLPKTCGPGTVCAAAEGRVECSVGDVGVPDELVVADLSFADAAGTGSH